MKKLNNYKVNYLNIDGQTANRSKELIGADEYKFTIKLLIVLGMCAFIYYFA